MDNLDPTGGVVAPPGFQPQDARLLAALLANLLPMLTNLAPEAAAGLATPSLGAWPHPPQPQFPLAPLGDNPQIAQQAAVALVQDITADCLRRLSSYLERQAGRQPALEPCIGVVTQAAQCFAVRDVSTAFSLICQAYRGIAMVRAAHPELPPVQDSQVASATTH